MTYPRDLHRPPEMKSSHFVGLFGVLVVRDPFVGALVVGVLVVGMHWNHGPFVDACSDRHHSFHRLDTRMTQSLERNHGSGSVDRLDIRSFFRFLVNRLDDRLRISWYFRRDGSNVDPSAGLPLLNSDLCLPLMNGDPCLGVGLVRRAVVDDDHARTYPQTPGRLSPGLPGLSVWVMGREGGEDEEVEDEAHEFIVEIAWE